MLLTPQANSFFTAKDVSRFIPAAYSELNRRFFQEIKRRNRQDKVRIFEYTRPGWTFHAKGIWCILPGENKPSVTLIGSANLGMLLELAVTDASSGGRSRDRDVEAQMILITENEALKTRINEEFQHMQQHMTLVTEDTFQQKTHQANFLVKLACKWVANYF